MGEVAKSPCAFCGDFQGVRQGSAFCSDECRVSWICQKATWNAGMVDWAPSLKPGETIMVAGIEYVMT